MRSTNIGDLGWLRTTRVYSSSPSASITQPGHPTLLFASRSLSNMSATGPTLPFELQRIILELAFFSSEGNTSSWWLGYASCSQGASVANPLHNSRRTAHLFPTEVLLLSKLYYETYIPLLYRDIDCHMASRRMSKLAQALTSNPALGGHVRRLRLWQRQPGAGAGVIFLAPTEQEEMRCILAACEPQILHLVLCSFPETALECIRPMHLCELSITIYEHSRYVSSHSELDIWFVHFETHCRCASWIGTATTAGQMWTDWLISSTIQRFSQISSI